MKTLKDIQLCLHPGPEVCFYHLFLTYKALNATITLPEGHPACACDHCKWLNRGEDFHSPME